MVCTLQLNYQLSLASRLLKENKDLRALHKLRIKLQKLFMCYVPLLLNGVLLFRRDNHYSAAC